MSFTRKHEFVAIAILFDFFILPVTKKLVQVYAGFVYTTDLKVICKEAAAYTKMKISCNKDK